MSANRPISFYYSILRIGGPGLNLRPWTFMNNWITKSQKKRFCNRETNCAAYCAIHSMSFKPSLHSMQLKWLTLLLIQWSQPITIKGRQFSQSWNPYTPYCSSSVESIFNNHWSCLYQQQQSLKSPQPTHTEW